MCGIWAMICAKPYSGGMRNAFNDKKRFIEEGMLISAFRGIDGTGIATVHDPYKSPLIYKRALDSHDFLNLKQTGRLINEVENSHAVLCHTRSSTKAGYLNDESAHPFQYGPITMVHNGVVDNYRALTTGCEVDVDSAWFAKALSEAKDPIELLKKTAGHYAFMWHDSRDGSINVVRNEGRPLHWAHIPAWNAVVFGSEYPALAYVLDRNNITIKDKFWYPKANVFWKFKMGKELEITSTPFVPTTHVAHSHGSTGRMSREETRSENFDWTTTKDPKTGVLSIKPEVLKILEERANKMQGIKDKIFPVSKKAVKKATAKLDALGLYFGKPYGATPKAFIPYKISNPDVGCAVLVMNGSRNKARMAEIHNLPKEVYDSHFEGFRYVLARAVNVRIVDGVPAVILKLDTDLVDFDIPRERTKGNMIPHSEKAMAEMLTKDLAKIEPPQDDIEQNDERHTVAVERGPMARPILYNSRMEKLYHGPANSLILNDEFIKLVEDGCQQCQGHINPEYHESVVWLPSNKAICHVCTADEQVMQSLGIAHHAIH